MGIWFWVALGGLAYILIACAGISQKKGGGSAAGKDTRRIDHLHYLDLDEYECPKCGARFTKNVMVCPKCGARFSGRKEDDEAFIEEMEIWDDDDD